MVNIKYESQQVKGYSDMFYNTVVCYFYVIVLAAAPISDETDVSVVVYIPCSKLLKRLEFVVVSMVICTINNTWSHSIE